MDKMQSPLTPMGGGNNNNKGSDNTSQNTNDRGMRKLISHMEDRTLQRRLPDGKLDRKLSDDPLDTHLTIGEGENNENKIDELTVPKKQEKKIKSGSILDDLDIIIPPSINDYNTLVSFMHNHVVDLRFVRKTSSIGRSDSISNQQAGQTRRMVCTCNWKFLSSIFTRRIFNWNTPKTRRGISWYKRRNLIIVWDLMVHNFRIIPVGNIRFVSAYKCSSLLEKGRFILFYNKNIKKLSPTQQAKYFNM